MKNGKRTLKYLIGSLVCAAPALLAQGLVIQSLNHNGELVATGLAPGAGATVEWAPTLSGPWNGSWASLQQVIANQDGDIRAQVPRFYRVRLSSPDPSRLVWIAPGSFEMGSPLHEAERHDNETSHPVTISQGFWMGKYEVTQEEYLEVVGVNPSFFSGTNLPVEQVSWANGTNYCALLTERERSAGRLPEGHIYRLPTEAEWEYACRAGTTTAFHYGAALASRMANFNGNYEYVSSIGTLENPNGENLDRTTRVGSYEPNAWGLYDMHGNVFEWCHDWYADYSTGAAIDPAGPVNGAERVLRGGSWAAFGRYNRSALRSWWDSDEIIPGENGAHVLAGFRVVLGRELAVE